MKTKEILKPRGVRFSDEQWSRLENRAARENKKNENARTTASDVVRHAVGLMEEEDELTET